MHQRLRSVLDVFASAFRNPDLRDVGLAYALFVTGEIGLWISLLVWAFSRGGASAELGIILVQLVPSIVLAPMIGSAADRWDPARTLVAGYALQVTTIGAVAAAIGLGAPAVVVWALAPLTCLAMCLTRPPQSALFPSVVRTADELTAANVMTGWTEGAAALAGPAVAGVLLAWRGVSTAVAAMALLNLVSLVLALRVARALRRRTGGGRAEHHPPPTDEPGLLVATRATLATTLLDPQIRMLLVLTTFFYLLLGALDYLCVVLALGILHMGPGGAGYLNAAIGVGELAAAFVTAFLVGRHPLARTLTLSLLGSVTALALVAVDPRVGVALALFGLVGLSLAVYNTTSKTLMQRVAPPDAIAGTFSVLESLMNLGLALGSVLVYVGYSVAGPRFALVSPALAALVLLGLSWRRLRQIDDTADVPQVEIRLLRSIRMFAPLPAPSIEALARELVPVRVAAGTRVIAEGDPGDRYYAVADGELDVTRGDELLQRIGRGDGFGEIALIRDVPRTATVTARSDALLYGLDGELFVETIMGNPAAGRAAGEVVDGHLGATDRGGDPPDAVT